MLTLTKNLYDYRELMSTLAWKNIALRYKQAYLGIAWAILKPITLMLIFTLVKSFVGIESGGSGGLNGFGHGGSPGWLCRREMRRLASRYCARALSTSPDSGVLNADRAA